MNKSVIVCALTLGVCVSVYAGEWKSFDGNPVLGDKKLGTCFDVNVVTDGPVGTPYTMYFSWRSGGHTIALVRSQDGFSWTQEPEICLRPDKTTGWEDMLNRTTTVKKDGVWHMWYTGQVFENGCWRKGWSKIGYAVSKDGLHFERVRKDPVLVPELPWEKQSVMNPYVRWDETRQVWRMWYAAGEIYEPNVLGYAESKDGLEWKRNPEPCFTGGDRFSWDRDRVGACEVHPLPEGGYVMFYIGYSDIDTARIGCAFSKDGVTGWRRHRGNPIVSPDVCTWNGSACYKPSVVRDEKNKRWLLWYNGRNGAPEYIGMAVHDGLDLEVPPAELPDTEKRFRTYVKRFNGKDDELYTNAIPNSAAEEFLVANCPRFACPDKDIERTFAFRWWTYRKHLKRAPAGEWIVSEFLPDVSWAGYGNMISCPFIHHVREGRWLRDPQYLRSYIRTMLEKGNVNGTKAYASAPAWCALEYAAVTGDGALAPSLLDGLVGNYEKWEQGWATSSSSYSKIDDGRFRRFHAGFRPERGLFDFDGNHEGTEMALSTDGARPMVNSMMWAEAKAIAEIARAKGETAIAETFAKKAAELEKNIKARLWREDVGFFTTLSVGGVHDTVCDLNGFAPFYFSMPLDGGYDTAFAGLSDPKGFYATLGLTCVRQDTPGFDVKIDVNKHECLWNGPSWPYSTSVALTALANRLHKCGVQPSTSNLQPSTFNLQPSTFNFLLTQYAWQHRRQRVYKEEGDYTIVPWIDENCHPETGEWIARRVMIEWAKNGKKGLYRERGKDYNHSTFCDLVISGLVGFLPDGEKGFSVDPLFPADWDYLVLDNLRYRGHEIAIRWHRGKGFVVTVDGREAARSGNPERIRVDLKEKIYYSMSEEARAYLEKPSEERCAGKEKCKDKVSKSRNAPAVPLVWKNTKKPFSLTVRRVKDGRVFLWTQTDKPQAGVGNLEVGFDYDWSVIDGAGRTVGEGRITMADLPPRCISGGFVDNMRDLGGWKGLGGRRVRQGLIYRSAYFDNCARFKSGQNYAITFNNDPVTEAERHDFVPGAKIVRDMSTPRLVLGQLGIRTDLDVRSPHETWGLPCSPLGEAVKYFNVPLVAYSGSEDAKQRLAAAFRVLFDERNYPIVFHCAGGNDRTGTLAFFANGLLGVSMDDLMRDYEFSFTTMDWANLAYRKSRLGGKLKEIVEACEGETLVAKFESFVKSCGFTDADIARFRRQMLED